MVTYAEANTRTAKKIKQHLPVLGHHKVGYQ